MLQQTINCGCKITRYGGGRTALSGCNIHKSKIGYQCGVCGKWGSKKDIAKHKEKKHAY